MRPFQTLCVEANDAPEIGWILRHVRRLSLLSLLLLTLLAMVTLVGAYIVPLLSMPSPG